MKTSRKKERPPPIRPRPLFFSTLSTSRRLHLFFQHLPPSSPSPFRNPSSPLFPKHSQSIRTRHQALSKGVHKTVPKDVLGNSQSSSTVQTSSAIIRHGHGHRSRYGHDHAHDSGSYGNRNTDEGVRTPTLRSQSAPSPRPSTRPRSRPRSSPRPWQEVHRQRQRSHPRSQQSSTVTVTAPRDLGTAETKARFLRILMESRPSRRLRTSSENFPRLQQVFGNGVAHNLPWPEVGGADDRTPEVLTMSRPRPDPSGSPTNSKSTP